MRQEPRTSNRRGEPRPDPLTRAIPRLREQMRGSVVTPDDAGYDEARALYNGMIDKRPRLIARCRDQADVILAVRFGRDHGMRTAIRGGGHNGPGLGSVDDGLVIDLSAMRGVRVDPTSRTARAAGGCVWGDVDHATHAFGLATPSGIIATTGVGGLTLGGGHGYLSRKYGLTIDNLRSADVVLADGRSVRAASDENADLFWALRGGGGNFGVVTSFELLLHPVREVVAGPTLWELDDAPEVMRWYADLLAEADEDLYGFFAFLVVPPADPFPAELHGRKMCGVVWCFTGPDERADEVFAPILGRAGGRPRFAHVGPVPYPALQRVFDPLYPPGLEWYWRGDFVRELGDAAIEAHVRFARELPTPMSTMHLYPVDGAVHRVAADATAFHHRDARWSQVIVGVSDDPGDRQRITQWTKDYWEAVHPHTSGGAYVNFMMEEGPARVRATYGDNYDKLQAIKRRYDPDNFFRVNQNIPPRG
jgi:FAD/FMN-containing dehydrogenase